MAWNSWYTRVDEEISFRKVLEALYRAGGDDTLWPGALKRISGFFGATTSLALILLDSERNPLRVLSAFGDAHDAASLQELPAGLSSDIASDDRYLSAIVNIDAEHSCLVMGARCPHRDPAMAADKERLKRLLPHIEQAVKIGAQVAGLKQCRVAVKFVLDTVSHGVFLLDSRGRAVRSNRTADELIAARDGLSLTDGFLHHDGRHGERTLQALIAAAIVDTAAGSRKSGGGTLCLPRPSGRAPYHVLVMPLPSCSAWGTINGIVAVVMVVDSAHEIALPAEMLISHFGLTRRQATLAILLATGRNVEECAKALKISRNTARAHQQHIYRKTQTRRHAELVRLLLNLPFVPAGPAAEVDSIAAVEKPV